MTRSERIRVSESEKQAIERVRAVRYTESMAESLPLGAVVGDVMEEELERQEEA